MEQAHEDTSLSAAMKVPSEAPGYASLLNSIPLGFFRCDAVWTLTDMNPAFVSIFGAGSVSDLAGKPFVSLVADTRNFVRMKDAVADKGWLRNCEMQFRTAEGKTFWGLITAAAAIAAGDMRVEGMVEDVSELRRNRESSRKVEEALQASEEKYRTLVESANDAIFLVCARSGEILEANKKAGELLGKSCRRLIGTALGAIFPAEDRQFYEKHILQNIRREKNARLAAMVSFRDRLKIPVQISSSIIELAGRKMILCIVSDITELKRFEETLRIEKHGLEKLIDKKTLEIFRIQNKLESARRLSDIGTLASTVAHELRNPLGVINAAVYNIKKKSGDPALQEHIAHIEKKILESDQIIKNLLSYSKINLPHVESVKIVELLEECAGEIRKKYEYPDAQFVLEADCERNAVLEADPVHLSELVTNILDNAFQALEGKKGTVRLRCDYRKSSNRVTICCQDTGRGMDDEELEKVFEPFFTRKTKGIGLGMTVCRQIVSLHGGTISIKSARGKGTLVSVCIPIKRKT